MLAVEHNWPTAFEKSISAVVAYNDLHLQRWPFRIAEMMIDARCPNIESLLLYLAHKTNSIISALASIFAGQGSRQATSQTILKQLSHNFQIPPISDILDV